MLSSNTNDRRGVIVGSGVVARAFKPYLQDLPRVCIYAAGVSNSRCTDPREFERERERLAAATADLDPDWLLLYFGTCSAGDPASRDSAYVLHKRAMENWVAPAAASDPAPAAAGGPHAESAHAAQLPARPHSPLGTVPGFPRRGTQHHRC